MTGAASRIPGPGHLLYSLTLLRRRVQQYAEHRARTDTERRWAAQFYDQLDMAFGDGTANPDARASLRAHTARRARSQKTPNDEDRRHG